METGTNIPAPKVTDGWVYKQARQMVDSSCLVSTDGESIDHYLIAGLMTAILKLGEEIVESELESITFKGQQIYYLQKEGCLTIVQVSRDTRSNCSSNLMRDY
ncbi:MAG: hypothetical protein ACETWM_00060 [Candidatus Lokiarchaeia archaeon]